MSTGSMSRIIDIVEKIIQKTDYTSTYWVGVTLYLFAETKLIIPEVREGEFLNVINRYSSNPILSVDESVIRLVRRIPYFDTCDAVLRNIFVNECGFLNLKDIQVFVDRYYSNGWSNKYTASTVYDSVNALVFLNYLEHINDEETSLYRLEYQVLMTGKKRTRKRSKKGRGEKRRKRC